MRPIVQNALLAYAVITTTAIGITLAVAHARETPGTITAQQIRIVEPDGTLRLVLSDQARFPDLIEGGKSYPHPRESAGMLFFDNEGSEIGGLTYNGSRDATGKVSNEGSLSFDRYRQDQAIQMVNTDDGDRHTSGFVVFDRPDAPLDVEGYARITAMPEGPAKETAVKTFVAKDPALRRVFIGRAPDSKATLALSDAKQHPRLVMSVSPEGAAQIQFLDADGKVTRTIDGMVPR